MNYRIDLTSVPIIYAVMVLVALLLFPRLGKAEGSAAGGWKMSHLEELGIAPLAGSVLPLPDPRGRQISPRPFFPCRYNQ